MLHKKAPNSRPDVFSVPNDLSSIPNPVGLSLVPARKQHTSNSPSSLLDLAIITSRRCSSFFAEAVVLVSSSSASWTSSS